MVPSRGYDESYCAPSSGSQRHLIKIQPVAALITGCYAGRTGQHDVTCKNPWSHAVQSPRSDRTLSVRPRAADQSPLLLRLPRRRKRDRRPTVTARIADDAPQRLQRAVIPVPMGREQVQLTKDAKRWLYYARKPLSMGWTRRPNEYNVPTNMGSRPRRWGPPNGRRGPLSQAGEGHAESDAGNVSRLRGDESNQ